MTSALPNKLSALIRVAVYDTRLCEDDPRYTLSMYDWHRPSQFDDRGCLVCMAGAVMAKTLETPITKYLNPMDTPITKISNPMDTDSWKYYMLAVDSVRVGCVENALSYLDVTKLKLNQEAVVDHSDKIILDGIIATRSGMAPYDVYLKCADMLEEVGL